MKPIAPVTILCLLLLAASGCGTARRGEPLQQPLPISSTAIENGQRAFMQNCHQCHPNGTVGLAPALNDKPLPKFLIRLQTRTGIGAMPAFGPSRIPEQDVRDIAAYLAALRDLPPPPTT